MTQHLPRLPHRSQLRVQQLNMILRLIEHRSVSAAAADLRLSQSAVTKALHEVESIFGVMLFHREARGLRPTSYCDVVERFAREVVIGLDETVETLRSLLAGERGAVSIGVSPGQPQRVLAQAMAPFRAQHARVQVGLHEGTGPQLLELLDAGRIDFALMAIPPDLDRERHASVVLGRELAQALVRPLHPLNFEPRPLAIRSVLGCGWILPPAHDPVREWLTMTWQGYEMDVPADVIEADAGAALDLAAELDLVCVATESQARLHLQLDRLVPLPLPFSLPTLPFGLVRRRRRHIRPEALHALRAIRETLRRSSRRGVAAIG
jgi:DNA-binding transcriptional LysR family regulator